MYIHERIHLLGKHNGCNFHMMKGLHIGSLHRSISGYDRICYPSFDVLVMLVGILQKLLQKFLVLLCMAQLVIHSEEIITIILYNEKAVM